MAQGVAVTEEDMAETPPQFWKDHDICDCTRNCAWAWGGVTKMCMGGIWKKTAEQFVRDFKGFSMDAKVVKINEAGAEKANDFPSGVDDEDPGEPLEVVPGN